ncbi:MAG: hypothetical protein HOP18_09855 [Deltaproteobacteria bacterium]|nr:hypothetical protein [Deltaproteobacteria bacterium]
MYEGLPIGRRSALHQRIGARTEAAYGAQASEIAAELAVHFERGRDYKRAVQYFERAAQNAIRRNAYREATNHLTTALELLHTLPDTRERAQQELLLHITLGVPLRAIRGISSPEVKATYTRARELCRQGGETRQLFPVLAGLWAFHHVRGEIRTARELGEQLLGLAHREHDPTLLVEAYWIMLSTLFPLGEFGEAQAHLTRSLALYDAQRYDSPVFLYGGIELEVFSLAYVYAAFVLWHLGYPDQALQQSEAALTLAQELLSPFSLAGVQFFAAILHQLRREISLIQEWAGAAILLAREHGFPNWVAGGTVLQGWAWVEQGQREEGISQIRQGLTIHQTLGAGLLQTYLFALLAEASGKARQAEEGLAALTEALTLMDKSGERFYEAELYRLYGELSLRMGERETRQTGKEEKISPSPLHPLAHSSPEECFLKAIEVAQHQQAKSLELRAAMSLARLWQNQGKRKEAHKLLAEIYGWFTEGAFGYSYTARSRW